jgi:hypothetical protein
MKNQQLLTCFLSFLKDAGLILWSVINDWNLFSNKSYRNIDSDFKYTTKNTFKSPHFKGERPIQPSAICGLIFEIILHSR